MSRDFVLEGVRCLGGCSLLVDGSLSDCLSPSSLPLDLEGAGEGCLEDFCLDASRDGAFFSSTLPLSLGSRSFC